MQRSPPRESPGSGRLDDPQRPVGALLFAGPTGVGNTELASSSRARCSADAERLVRVDMSELVTARRSRG